MKKTLAEEKELFYAQELNRRAVYLRLRGKLWLVPAGALLGALLGLLLYTLATTVFADARQYQEVSKLYLDFAYDETGNVYDYYNGATWTDLLTADPALSEPILAALPQGTDLQLVKDSVKAEILSDIRLLTVTVTNPDEGMTRLLADAVNGALVSFGGTAKEFTKITLLSVEGPRLLLLSDRTRNAVLLGLVLGALAAAFALWIGEILNDAFYVPEDAARRCGAPVLGATTRDAAGVCGAAQDGDGLAETPWTAAVLRSNLALYCRDKKNVVVLALTEDAVKAETGNQMEEADGKTCRLTVCEAPRREQDFASCRAADGVVLALRFGRRGEGTRADALRAQLAAQGVTVGGVVLTEADARFLRRYYRQKD